MPPASVTKLHAQPTRSSAARASGRRSRYVHPGSQRRQTTAKAQAALASLPEHAVDDAHGIQRLVTALQCAGKRSADMSIAGDAVLA